MRRFQILLAPAALALVACGPPANLEDGAPAATDEVCNAAIYSHLVGEPIGVADTLPTRLEVRVLAADAFVTKDFNPNRLTFTTTTKDTVGRVFCG